MWKGLGAGARQGVQAGRVGQIVGGGGGQITPAVNTSVLSFLHTPFPAIKIFNLLFFRWEKVPRPPPKLFFMDKLYIYRAVAPDI